ncbi:hypothetical protein BHU09_02870 [Tannerella sp. oral taxon 808]|nr:hypothetical protein BHU09_02870 [Tannerella sp. oral taxon 808]
MQGLFVGRMIIRPYEGGGRVVCRQGERSTRLFVVVMSFDLDDEHGDFLVMDVINDSIVSRDAPRIGDSAATSQWLWVPNAFPGMFGDLIQNDDQLLI